MAAPEKLQVPQSGIQTILGDLTALSQLNNLFRGNKGSTSTETTSSGGMDFMYRQALEDIQGLSSVSSGQRRAGLYGSSTNTLLTNDFLTRAAGEVAKGNSTKTAQTGAAPRQLNPSTMLLGTLGLQLAKKVDWDGLGNSVSNFFGGSSGSEAGSFGAEDLNTGLGTNFTAPAEADFSYDFSAPSADLDFGGDYDFSLDDLAFGGEEGFFFSDFKDGGRVGKKKKSYADGGRVPTIYGSPDEVTLNRRGMVKSAPQRARITPAGAVRRATTPLRRGREPFLNEEELMGSQLISSGLKSSGALANPVGATLGGINRMTRGRPEDLEEGLGQAVGSYAGAVLGSVGGPVGTMLGSQAGGKFGGDVIGGVIGGISKAAEDVPDFLDKVTGGSLSFITNPFNKLFMDGGLVTGHDRSGEDDVNINVSGGEVIIPTDVVDVLGAEFFEQLIQMFHKPIDKGA